MNTPTKGPFVIDTRGDGFFAVRQAEAPLGGIEKHVAIFQHRADAEHWLKTVATAPELLSTLQALCDAVKVEREAQDRYIQVCDDEDSSGHAMNDAIADIEDANATIIICEHNARAAIAKAKGGAA